MEEIEELKGVGVLRLLEGPLVEPSVEYYIVIVRNSRDVGGGDTSFDLPRIRGWVGASDIVGHLSRDDRLVIELTDGRSLEFCFRDHLGTITAGCFL